MDVKEELIRALTSKPKYIPLWYRYDKEGSHYNDLCLTENQHYYMHTSEMGVLTEHVQEIIDQASSTCALVDLGSGNSTKTRILIDTFLKQREHLTYIPVDISTEFVQEVCESLRERYGSRLIISPVYGDYEKAIDRLCDITDDKLIVWFGSLQNLGIEEQIQILQRLSGRMNKKDRLLISLDVTESEEEIYNAYFDTTGYSNMLYYNSILRLNRDYGANMDTNKFQLIGTFHRTTHPEDASKFTVRLISIGDQVVEIPGLGLTMYLYDGEFVNLNTKENGVSCKYTLEQIHSLVCKGNLQICRQWISKDRHVAFSCLAKA